VTAPSVRANHMTGVYRVDRTVHGLKDVKNGTVQDCFAGPGRIYEVVDESVDSLYLKFLNKPADGSDSAKEVQKHGIYGVNRAYWETTPLTHAYVRGWYIGVLGVPFKYHLKVPGTPGQMTGGSHWEAPLGTRSGGPDSDGRSRRGSPASPRLRSTT